MFTLSAVGFTTDSFIVEPNLTACQERFSNVSHSYLYYGYMKEET